MIIEPTPTKRAVIDPLRACPLRCKFCYYRFGDMKSIQPFEKIKVDMDNAISRRNTYFDVTGGEPCIYPQIVELIEYALERNIKTCIITSGISGEKQTQRILDAGIDDWLVSIHGLEVTHDYLVGRKGARMSQVRFLSQIREKMSFRFNFVMNRYNQDEIVDVAKWMIHWRPRIVNFINMNPHHEWKNHQIDTAEVIADLRRLEPELNKAIEILENEGTGVNIRYYPMCRIAEKYRRTVCNDMHVIFDNFEWDYNLSPKTFEVYRQAGINMSKSVEMKEPPCSECDLQSICGGINKPFFLASDNPVDPVRNTGIDPQDFYHYRKHNVLTLKERL